MRSNAAGHCGVKMIEWDNPGIRQNWVNETPLRALWHGNANEVIWAKWLWLQLSPR